MEQLLLLPDKEIVSNACDALKHFTDDDHTDEGVKIQALLDPRFRFCSRLVELFSYADPTSPVYECDSVMSTLSNIVAGTDLQTEAVVAIPEFMPILKRHLAAKTSSVRKEAFRMLSNVAAGTMDHKKLILKHGILPMIIHATLKDYNKVSIEAVWAFTNLLNDISEDPKIADFLLDSKGIRILC